jgi:hypothetical protein
MIVSSASLSPLIKPQKIYFNFPANRDIKNAETFKTKDVTIDLLDLTLEEIEEDRPKKPENNNNKIIRKKTHVPNEFNLKVCLAVSSYLLKRDNLILKNKIK